MEYLRTASALIIVAMLLVGCNLDGQEVVMQTRVAEYLPEPTPWQTPDVEAILAGLETGAGATPGPSPTPGLLVQAGGESLESLDPFVTDFIGGADIASASPGVTDDPNAVTLFGYARWLFSVGVQSLFGPFAPLFLAVSAWITAALIFWAQYYLQLAISSAYRIFRFAYKWVARFVPFIEA